MRTFNYMIGLAILLGVAGHARATVIFSDDFNRPDGPVGNGWTEIGPNTAVIANQEVTLPGAVSAGGIYRPIASGPSVRIEATLEEKQCEHDAGKADPRPHMTDLRPARASAATRFAIRRHPLSGLTRIQTIRFYAGTGRAREARSPVVLRVP